MILLHKLEKLLNHCTGIENDASARLLNLASASCLDTYMSQTRDQQRFTISEVAADWHEPMVPQRIMWPSIARTNGQLDPRCS